MSQRKRTRNERLFYIISLIIVASLIFGTIAVAIYPNVAGF
jgi:hypothetical protein